MVQTIPSLLLGTAKRRPYAPAYYVKSNGSWKPTNWKQYAAEVTQAGKALIALGLAPGGNVAILGFNCPEWTIFNIAAMAVGGSAAGVYTTSSPDEVQYVVHHAESLLILVENREQWQKIASRRDKLPLLKHVVTMKAAPAIDDPLVMTWDAFMSRGDAVSDKEFHDRLGALQPDGLATLIYTSGTTGPPKGVMLSHRNLEWTATALASVTGSNCSDVTLSYLPLSHIAEQMVTIHSPAVSGAAVYYAESIARVPDNLREVRPHIFFGVPRIWEKFCAAVTAKLKQASGGKKHMVQWARKVAAEANRAEAEGRGLHPALRVQYRAAQRLVLGKIKEALGMARARVCLSGAAPISQEVLDFFASLDIVVYEVYGQSEGSGPTTINVPGKNRTGTVGAALPGVEVKIAADGEILVQGPNVFLGYYKDPQATSEALADGWLHSGDLGVLDDGGFLTITGRKKDIIITAGGKNIAPKNIEAALKNAELVEEAIVIGDRRKYLTALITIDREALAAISANGGVDDPEVYRRVQKAIDEVNSTLARAETIKRFTILPRPLTIEDGELTPTLKVKRNIVSEHFRSQIEAMYAE